MDGSSLLSGMCCLIWCNLPMDLIIEVLYRLPDKSLIQFKCVSKDWNFLITNICVPRLAASSPLSVVLRMSNLRHDKYCVITSEGHRDSEFVESCTKTLPFPNYKVYNLDFICCFNGLVLISRYVKPKEYYVCNPATQQCVSIPVNPNHLTESIMSLAYNPHNNTYKIVRIAYSSDGSTLSSYFEIFSSVTGEWRSFRMPRGRRIIGSKWLHRLVYWKEYLYALSFSSHLLRFDLHGTDTDGKKKYLRGAAKELPVKADGQNMGLISLSNACLYYSKVEESILRIWSLEAGRSKNTCVWVLKYSVSIDKLRQLPCGKYLSPSVLTFEIDPASDVIYLGNQHGILKYNLRTNKLELFHKMKKREKIFHDGGYFYTYRRSLVILPSYFST